MLAASPSAPKHPLPRHAPRPHNWQGVQEGLTESARQLRAGELDAAEQITRQVLEFAPREGRAWHLLGRILQQAGRHGEALECFERAHDCYRDAHPDTPPASLRLARLLWAQGERAEALAMLDLLLMRQPNDEELRTLRETWADAEERGANE